MKMRNAALLTSRNKISVLYLILFQLTFILFQVKIFFFVYGLSFS